MVNETQVKITSLIPTTSEMVIGIQELNEKLKQNTVDLIDVRTPQEHEQYNIGGINLPLEDLFDDAPSLNSD